eukprot:TRINITY_DN3797_c0_g2_i1.p1 TRINITY_DN3797_c0_g2~~TRINITY_DN3797_c0_g2_i1.p1  ORF type:complete len:419 (+),score=96.29 TRINITY_DN3797_c0_g2_i1:383-1639(+)
MNVQMVAKMVVIAVGCFFTFHGSHERLTDLDYSSRAGYKGNVEGVRATLRYMQENNLEPQNVAYVGRHASRFATNDKSCQQAGEGLQEKWTCPMDEAEVSKYDSITEKGKGEARGIGTRVGELLQKVVGGRKVVVQTTAKRRTKQTASQFLKGAGLEVSESDFVFSELHNDRDLRFFDVCNNYNKLWEKRDPADPNTKPLKTFEDTVLPKVVSSVAANIPFKDLTRKQAEAIYKECGYKWMLEEPSRRDEHNSVLCDVFSKTDFNAFSWHKDIKEYYKKGPGSRKYNGVQISCGTMQKLLKGLEKGTTVNLFFAHAETLVPMYSLLGLFSNLPPLPPVSPAPSEATDTTNWRLSRVCPMASNLIVILTNTQELLLLHDETLVPWEIGTGCEGRFRCHINTVKQALAAEVCDWDVLCND